MSCSVNGRLLQPADSLQGSCHVLCPFAGDATRCMHAARFHSIPAGVSIWLACSRSYIHLCLQEDLVAGLNVQQGQVCEKKHVKEDLEQLEQLGLFAGVTSRVIPVKTGSKRMRVELRFSEEQHPPMKSIRVRTS